MDPVYRLTYSWLNQNNTHAVTCCICKGKNKQIKIFPFEINGKKFFIVQCSVDKLMYLSPQPGAYYCRALYNHPSYFSGTDDMYGLFLNDKKAKKIATTRIKEALYYKPDAQSFIEIGCGYGYVLQEALRKGIKQVKGLEFSHNAVISCKKNNLNVSYIDANKLIIKNSGKKFDIVAIYSVLEHLRDPSLFLKKIEKIMSKKSILIIRVPETKPQQKPRLSLVDHFWHFTKKSLENILKKNNFDIIDSYPSGIFKGIQHKGSLPNITIVARLKNSRI